ncbi:hypothetical protein [Heyndrickxia oleronia]|uniref:Lipoprotein n=1 Tax=Heyndrickxia oleronia TaxID=38875 RepID=A0A8E2IA41_9BACI|nr:hypothetical protein [Heyndrickxia oleronia]MEC1376892.1 hypothetical protein [Heyndrickxia oleronia]OJH17120.1 hypothetical protein BLX88_19805 [Bacillus obstructivus]OOP67130.1 hypothetical protein BWZ43_17385 [Heyndrickxia oleronia]QQZ03732.1 hypothetical protein I5818_18545 [Heyndrickxia oleronia]
MRQLCIICVLLLSPFIGLTGCISEAKRDRMVSDEKGKYNLYIVGDDIIDNKLEKETDINNIFRMIIESDYKNSKNNTPYLKITENKPNYFVFDSKDLVYQTTSYKNLVKYLKEHPNAK